MKRDLVALTKVQYDLVVIGGGIYGATAAWEAASRGLAVALLDKADFGGATSANSLKIIHGGLRYLQHADFARMRESIRERRALMRIAPHLVSPLPVLIPTYGLGLQSLPTFAVAMAVNDLVSFDRNRSSDRTKRIPNGRLFSRREALRLLPGIREKGLTGAALFYDAQAANTERLTLEFVRSAAAAGADVANYAEVSGLLRRAGRVEGVTVTDRLGGERFEVRARAVLNASGPWVDGVLGASASTARPFGARFAKAVNVVTRALIDEYAAGLPASGQYRDADARFNKGSRMLFVAPWRGRSLIGTTYVPFDERADDLRATHGDVTQILAEINAAYPGANLTPDDVSFVHAGLVPMESADQRTGNVRLTKHFSLRDHTAEGAAGLVSVLGVKYTTARDVAEKTIDHIFRSWGKTPPRSVSARTPLFGGKTERPWDSFVAEAMRQRPQEVVAGDIARLVRTYGSAYTQVLDSLSGLAAEPKVKGELRRPPNRLLTAEILHTVREEMAVRLSDLVFRRLDLASASHPGAALLGLCAETMGVELGWDQERMRREIAAVEEAFSWQAAKEEPSEARVATEAI